MVLHKKVILFVENVYFKMFYYTYSANLSALFLLLFLFSFFIITLILTYLNSEKDLVKQAKTLNSAANKLIQKHH